MQSREELRIERKLENAWGGASGSGGAMRGRNGEAHGYFSGRRSNDKIGLGIASVGGEEIALREVEAVRVLLWS